MILLNSLLEAERAGGPPTRAGLQAALEQAEDDRERLEAETEKAKRRSKNGGMESGKGCPRHDTIRLKSPTSIRHKPFDLAGAQIARRNLAIKHVKEEYHALANRAG